MSLTCLEHDKEFIMGCIKCNKEFCFDCVLNTETLTCLHDKDPYDEFVNIKNGKIKENIMKNLELLNEKKKGIIETIANFGHVVESLEKEEQKIIELIRSTINKIEMQVRSRFKSSKAIMQENIHILSIFV